MIGMRQDATVADRRLRYVGDVVSRPIHPLLLHFAMTPDDFRRLALSQRKAVEVYRWGHSEFACLEDHLQAWPAPADSVATVRLTSEQQARFVDAAPRIFVPAPGAWGRLGATSVVSPAAAGLLLSAR